MDERRIAVRGIIWQHGKLLAVRHKTQNGDEADYWATPGGGLNIGESFVDGITREMVEETGIVPTVGRLLFMQQFTFMHTNGKNYEQLELFFHITNSRDYETIDLTATTHGTLELARCEFINPKAEYLLPKFLTEIDIQSHIDNNRPVVMYSELDR